MRDLFLFACYTGLSFQDMMKLTYKDIINGIDGRPWLIIFRTKTKVRSAIPLLSQPLQIISKFNSDYRLSVEKPLLRQYSNQKYNAYLQEIADVCGINKHLTSHAARSTLTLYRAPHHHGK